MHMNTLVNMNLGDTPKSPDILLREPKVHERGFLCMGYTPHSTEAGSVRRLAHGVTVRLWSPRELDNLLEVVHSVLELSVTSTATW